MDGSKFWLNEKMGFKKIEKLSSNWYKITIRALKQSNTTSMEHIYKSLIGNLSNFLKFLDFLQALKIFQFSSNCL